ncbi:MAG TPA: SIS domain-containing protein [Sphingomicrobium sp.]|nr:SIS domain-containing protein [Sphingomicrobium sp.]
MAAKEDILARHTLMGREASETPQVVERQLAANERTLAELGERLRRAPPSVVVTCARGSSDHAATYGKYLIETLLGVPVASAAPSVASLYAAPPRTQGALLIVISQSGRSPDLIATVDAYRKSGTHAVVLVNDLDSPLAAMADTLLPLHAGPELAVAATKSCIAALAGLAAIVAAWSDDAKFREALRNLPPMLEQALELDWSAAADALQGARQMFVLGRGYSFGIAQEAALKLKETCSIQAEPFSSAEVRHGPMRVIERGFPVLGLATSDSAGDDVASTAREFAERGATAFIAGQGGDLPVVPGHPALEPIAMLASFYGMAERLSLARGMDPDSPPGLAKVTSTR